ncbi:TonB-dependent siderophore receptor [Ketogulonicigenium vulgare]|uniref:TonB-dependent siderophore receptor n=1 Tax=Ketogulonicigenium vulgare (strain WSH-001) TaxID=759362 RepID=F9YBA1_KETVW|nr:TonB-dependent siderophore receptor [Ketogulonicigenium vulgare]ADO44129.1 TonB-dependent siderophore receptor [Ketogulonicigenium vulgare Y25]AEM42653.1 TonB-dependent siderophore receptor [Ketogulonicigenium vulgare WSH-001]ALJ82458.1 TonB-dependent receptor [Ketogulonicigenium vulgare]ANW35244.1 TonB-dependent receptor [Ketogulonicigenium vulgare]AOZ53355.1 TonB-dependent siderophore receptor [Ketogulonicigenium vulgare]
MRKIHTNLLLGVSLGTLLAAGAALAQDRPTFLGVISVEGTDNPTAPLDGTVARTSASTKTGTPLVEVQGSVSVIPRAQLESQGAQNLAESLNYSAGIITENYGGDPRFDSLFLRGFNLENDKFLDGLRLMRSTQFPTSAPNFDLYGVERVEVLRGPASVLYGAGTPAGLVNLIQRRAQAYGDFGEVGVSGDTNGSWATYADANIVLDDRFAYRVTTRLSNSRTDVSEIDNERTYLALSASYALTDQTEIEFMASVHNDAPMSPTGIPNGFVGNYDARDLREFYFADDSINTSDRVMSTLSFGATHDFGNGWRLNGTFRHTNHDWTYENVYLGASSGSLANRGVIVQDEEFSAIAADIRLSGAVDTGAATHRLTFGIDAQKLEEVASTDFYDIAPIDFLAPTYGGISLGALTYAADKTVDATQTGLYALDEVSLGNWRASLGLRHEWTDQSGQNVNTYGTTDFARKDSVTTGHLGFGYVWDNGLAAYGSYTTSYLPQPGVDIENNPLEPTHGRQFELGLKYEPLDFDGLFTAALFDLRETDRNYTVTEDIGGTPVSGVRQIGEAQVQGLELEAVVELTENWALKGAYTYTQTEILAGDNVGNELANTPDHAASLFLSHAFGAGTLQGLTLSGGLRFIGERYTNDSNTATLDAVTLLDLGASYEWANGLVGRVNVSNVTDEAYISAVGYSSSYYGDGRNLQASLTYKW